MRLSQESLGSFRMEAGHLEDSSHALEVGTLDEPTWRWWGEQPVTKLNHMASGSISHGYVVMLKAVLCPFLFAVSVPF